MTDRCPWCKDDELYCHYHDTEWGVPLSDDQQLFEFLSLESAQAGLSWITILRKRENYRTAYKQFDINKVARFNAASVEKLLANPGIVRNRAKIEASIHNAKLFIDIQHKHDSFAGFYWRYVDGKPIQNKRRSLREVPATTELSDKIARDFKKLGFKFLGSTTIYAFMQATGMVNDHIVSCHRYETCRELGQGFKV
ncbi:MAG TPA: DNA-3-methyladenine glycosylase I [Spongiibacteraceae bacterium]|nr:DNA-3-methyladenine glycosylase I [Spongiibacteraceae bacterium]HCS27270.1 DNA-3-methyladenine glycosylase I [Spongiibacteraceae bacterium]|tara:strand:+ start:312 stop:899 length:588 start_codon:yes stop_codon:yes gene_type:complete